MRRYLMEAEHLGSGGTMKRLYAAFAVVSIAAGVWAMGGEMAFADNLIDPSLDLINGASPKNQGGSLLPCGSFEETKCEGTSAQAPFTVNGSGGGSDSSSTSSSGSTGVGSN